MAEALNADAVAGPTRFLSVDMAGGQPEQSREAFLELMTLGVGAGRIFQAQGDSAAGSNCVDLRIVGSKAGEAPRMGLWHAPRLFFGEGESKLDDNARRSVRYSLPGYEAGRTRFIVRAYTDTVGSAETNRRISQARAEATGRELIRLGARETDIEVEAFGESRLHRSTPDDTAEPLNRVVWVDVRVRP